MKNRMLTLMLCDTADRVRVDGRFTDHASVATPFSRTALWMSDGNDGKQTIKADSGVPELINCMFCPIHHGTIQATGRMTSLSETVNSLASRNGPVGFWE